MRSRVTSFARAHAFDLVVVASAVGAIVEFVLIRGDRSLPNGPLRVAVPAILAMTLPLLARRRYPFAAPALAVTSAAAFAPLQGHVTPHLFITSLTSFTVAFLFAYLNERRRAVAGLLLTWVMASAAALADAVTPGFGDVAFVVLVHGLAWLCGFVLHHRLQQARATEARLAGLEREQEERALAAVVSERARIARELHDVVGHHVSVMTVQAGAVRRLLHEDQVRERESLQVIERTGREALAEMRRMVGVLRRSEEAPALAPQPSLGQLHKLVDQTREAGLEVEVRVEGDPVPLPASLDLTAYRIVQEGLTNALKHAQAHGARVLVRYGPGMVELTVDDDGRGSASATGGGHGHAGMRERVSVYGGELEVGPRPGGGFRLRARLPVSAR